MPNFGSYKHADFSEDFFQAERSIWKFDSWCIKILLTVYGEQHCRFSSNLCAGEPDISGNLTVKLTVKITGTFTVKLIWDQGISLLDFPQI
jgi:hypothetical protein